MRRKIAISLSVLLTAAVLISICCIAFAYTPQRTFDLAALTKYDNISAEIMKTTGLRLDLSEPSHKKLTKEFKHGDAKEQNDELNNFIKSSRLTLKYSYAINTYPSSPKLSPIEQRIFVIRDSEAPQGKYSAVFQYEFCKRPPSLKNQKVELFTGMNDLMFSDSVKVIIGWYETVYDFKTRETEDKFCWEERKLTNNSDTHSRVNLKFDLPGNTIENGKLKRRSNYVVQVCPEILLKNDSIVSIGSDYGKYSSCSFTWSTI